MRAWWANDARSPRTSRAVSDRLNASESPSSRIEGAPTAPPRGPASDTVVGLASAPRVAAPIEMATPAAPSAARGRQRAVLTAPDRIGRSTRRLDASASTSVTATRTTVWR